MRVVRLLALVAMALCALGAVGTTVASAEEDTGSPSVLCLVQKCQELTATLTGGASKLVLLKSEKALEGAEVESSLKNCEAVAGTEEKDIRLCKDVPITFKGVKVTGTTTKCNTEGDALGTVKTLLDLHIASELSTGGVLQPLLLAKVLNSKLEAKEITIKCGAALTALVKGTIGCLLLPGLTNIPVVGGKVEVLCKVKAGTKDPETGTCQQLCEWLTETPFEGNLGGGFEDAWMEFHGSGAPSKDIFIDD